MLVIDALEKCNNYVCRTMTIPQRKRFLWPDHWFHIYSFFVGMSVSSVIRRVHFCLWFGWNSWKNCNKYICRTMSIIWGIKFCLRQIIGSKYISKECFCFVLVSFFDHYFVIGALGNCNKYVCRTMTVIWRK